MPKYPLQIEVAPGERVTLELSHNVIMRQTWSIGLAMEYHDYGFVRGADDKLPLGLPATADILKCSRQRLASDGCAPKLRPAQISSLLSPLSSLLSPQVQPTNQGKVR